MPRNKTIPIVITDRAQPLTNRNGTPVEEQNFRDARYVGRLRESPRCHGLPCAQTGDCGEAVGGQEPIIRDGLVLNACCTTHHCQVCGWISNVVWPR